MAAQLGLPKALAARGLTVEVVPGWETRSAGLFNPRGAVCHWTAGPAKTLRRASLSIVTKGRSDLPGPLCNVYLDRNGVAVVVAAGRANHAGSGSWRGATGNSSFFGTEAEAAGPDDFTAAQRKAYPLVNAAYCDLGGFGADMVCGHSEYAFPKGRKTDINGYTMDDMRAQVAAVLSGHTPTPAPQEDTLSAAEVEEIKAHINIQTNNLAAFVKGANDQVKALLVGGNTGGRNNFHWLADQIVAAVKSIPGAQVDDAALRAAIRDSVTLTAEDIATAVNDMADARDRDGDPSTGATS